MKCYAVPYEGTQDFIFFSYCHDNAAQVYPIIERLAIEGFRVWYDDGIHPGEDWPQVIAEHLSRAKACVAAISRASAESHNCRNEVSFAVANNKALLSIVMEDFKMPLGMKLQLSSSRFLKFFELPTESFYEALLSAPSLAGCKSHGSQPDSAALNEWKKHIDEYRRQESPAFSSSVEENAGLHWFRNEELRKQTQVNAQGNQSRVENNASFKDEDGEGQKESRKYQEYSAEIPQNVEEVHAYPEAERLKAETEARKRQAEEVSRITPKNINMEEAAPEQSEMSDDDDDKTVAIINQSPEDPTVMNNRYTPVLLIRTKNGEVFVIRSEQTVIGRTKSKSDVVVSGNKAISGKHAAIRKDGNRFSLYNLKPTNGTAVDGRELEADECVDLNPGSEIILADEKFFLIYGDIYDRVFDEQRLCFLQCRETGETRVLAEDRFPLDRNHQWKSKVLGDTRISRSKHAEICYERGRTFLRDLGSKNGTFLNGKELSPNENVELHDGDTIAVVETEFIFHELRIGA